MMSIVMLRLPKQVLYELILFLSLGIVLELVQASLFSHKMPANVV